MEKENDNEDMEKGGGDYIYICISDYFYNRERSGGIYVYINICVKITSSWSTSKGNFSLGHALIAIPGWQEWGAA